MNKHNIYMYLIFITTLYAAFSVQEWLAHKYLMHTHLNIKALQKVYANHLRHHNKTKHDYTIENNDPEYICVDLSTLDDFFQYVLLYTVNTGIFYIFFKNELTFTTISIHVHLFLIVNILVWNTFHSYIHGLDAYEICKPPGIPRRFINEKNIYTRWLIENHKAHHSNPKGNYNIVFPGADYLFGTHHTLKIE